ncbi:oligodendrocyte-myelin glycoprotein-like [Narcine bancroftii]|uniref:oligodendrocyte-myelin glycoprotein-like n=1 Tax=Narcine bancroftii TaxID=1343680 RepID=UPI0038318F06
MGYSTITGCLLAFLTILTSTIATCPLECSCSQNKRYVDCSGRNLTVLPHDIQSNVIFLNLSHNAIKSLDNMLTGFINLRELDISKNLLRNMPRQLPLALWEIYASNNQIKVLQKNDTVFQWNLKKLDVSNNSIERAVLINNTLSNLKFLNFSGNKFWTAPTNMPNNLNTLDLSHNNLNNILPDTFHQSSLSKLYLNNNRLQVIPSGTFGQLTGLQLISLYGNNWNCNGKKNAYLLTWLQTVPTVLGCPCTEKKEHGQRCVSSTSMQTTVRSTLISYQSRVGTVTSTRHQSYEDSTPDSLESQKTDTSPSSDSFSSSLHSTAQSFIGGSTSHIPTEYFTLQTTSTASSNKLVSITGGTTKRPSSTTMPISTPEFTSNSTDVTRSIAIINMSSTGMNNQTSRFTTPQTSESTSKASHTSSASIEISMVSESGLTPATTSRSAIESTSSPFQVASSSMTTQLKVKGTIGTSSTTNQIVATQNATSKVHTCLGITCFMVLIMLALLFA